MRRFEAVCLEGEASQPDQVAFERGLTRQADLLALPYVVSRSLLQGLVRPHRVASRRQATGASESKAGP